MSEDIKNKQCQICKGYLFDDDDIVVCPVCGAPHHRDCWETVGHCGAEETHGTDKQYNKVEAEKNDSEPDETVKQCRVCGRTSKSGDAAFCPYCGQPYDNFAEPPHVFISGVPFKTPDPYGGMPKDSMIEDVKVSDIAKFTGAASNRYIPKFAAMGKKNKSSWNWAAFIFPSAWCLSKKMYRNGILFLILAVASSLCFVPFNQTLMSLGDTSEMTREQLVELFMSNSEAFGPIVILMSVLGMVLWLVPRIICGVLGDWLYRGHALEKIRKINTDDEIDDTDYELQRSGSTSIVLMFAALLAEIYLPSIIAMFIW